MEDIVCSTYSTNVCIMVSPSLRNLRTCDGYLGIASVSTQTKEFCFRDKVLFLKSFVFVSDMVYSLIIKKQ